MRRSSIMLLLLALAATPGLLAAQTGGAAVAGVVQDAESGDLVPGAVVRTRAADGEVGPDQITDDAGRFLILGLNSGTYVIEVEHLAYGTQTDTLTVVGGEEVEIQFLVATVPVELAGITVTARAVVFDPQLTRGTRFDGMTADEVNDVRPRVSQTLDMLAMANIPGLTVSNMNGQICVESNRWRRRASDGSEPCHMVGVVIDDVVMANPRGALDLMNPEMIESWELLPPIEAGTLYGSQSMYGVLKIKTRDGYRPPQGFHGIASQGQTWAVSIAVHGSGSSTLHDGLLKVRVPGEAGRATVGYIEETDPRPGLELDLRWNSHSFGFLGGTFYGSSGTSTMNLVINTRTRGGTRDYSGFGFDLWWGANVFRGPNWNGQIGFGPTFQWQNLAFDGTTTVASTGEDVVLDFADRNWFSWGGAFFFDVGYDFGPSSGVFLGATVRAVNTGGTGSWLPSELLESGALEVEYKSGIAAAVGLRTGVRWYP